MKHLKIVFSLFTVLLLINSCDLLESEIWSNYSGNISEWCCDKNHYESVKNVKVDIYDLDNKLLSSTQTDENGNFEFNANVNKSVRIRTETYDIDTTITSHAMYNMFSSGNLHIYDWEFGNANICGPAECQIDDVIYYNSVPINGDSIVFEQMNNIMDHAVKKAKVRILNHTNTLYAFDVKRKTDLNDINTYWKRISVPSGTEYWFTIEEDTIFVLYNIRLNKVIGNELNISFSDDIETVERCDY